MSISYIHTCYRTLDPKKSTDFYVNKLGMNKVGVEKITAWLT
jgi:lactoylglutathione lyase